MAGCRDAVLGGFCGSMDLARMSEQKHRWVEVEDVKDGEEAAAGAL